MATAVQGVITPVSTAERTKLGIRPGDTVRVHQKVIELKKGRGANKKETTTKNVRTQVFEGLVIAVKHGHEAGGTFTVRAQMSGVGVEKIFPLYSPVIEKIEIVKRSKVRRAKLYFIREKVAREVRRQLRNMRLVKMSTDDYKEEPAVIEEAVVDEAPIEAGEPETAEETESLEVAEKEEAMTEAGAEIATEGNEEEKKVSA